MESGSTGLIGAAALLGITHATFWTLFALLVLGPCEPLMILFLPLAIAGAVIAGTGAVIVLFGL